MKRIYFSVLSLFFTALAMAQNSDVSADIHKGSSSGGFPWLWVVGGLLFIILLVALLSGGRGGSDRVVEKRTIIKD